jgi:hypothetical protein
LVTPCPWVSREFVWVGGGGLKGTRNGKCKSTNVIA